MLCLSFHTGQSKPYCNSCSNVPKVIPTHVGCHVEDADEYDKGDVARPARARSRATSRRTGKSTVEFTGRVGQTSTPFHTLADSRGRRGAMVFKGTMMTPAHSRTVRFIPKVMKQDVFVQRPDAAQHPRPFHRPRSRSVNRVGGSGGRTGAVRRGWPSGAGIDGSGVDMSEPLRALRDASAPVWRRGGIPIFVSDALNAARGNDILQQREVWHKLVQRNMGASNRRRIERKDATDTTDAKTRPI